MEDCFADWTLVLEYLRVLLTWPPLTFVLVLIILRAFRTQIADLIKRIKGGKLAGFEFSLGAGSAQANTRPDAPTPDLPDYDVLMDAFWYERFLNMVYGSQLEFLYFLENKLEGATAGDRDRFFEIHRQRYPETQYTPDGWSNWLHRWNMIEYVGGPEPRARIVNRGLNVLNYLRRYYTAGIPPRFG